ncbi:MAG: bifunctional folylpolyglutamate synthase/dihydrofolate synthase [Clostridia bacterium]|nr:bifunctional folylpolyglutamate synthase/dihydrofolate synthase [Clostridia bacterium]
MNREEVMNFIDNSKKFGSRLELVRIQRLAELLGNPQDEIRFIHVAGTNGKGSTSVFMHNILVDAGYKTGLYTSPFIYEFNERIQINNTPISDSDLTEIMTVVSQKVKIMTEEGYEHPTEFELITAAAFLYFKKQKCDYVILEVGLGGIYDATNIIKSPVLSVITSISLDHTDYLGNTVSDVAMNKCGIIKKGCPVLTYMNQVPDALEVIKETARKMSAPITVADGCGLEILKCDLSGNEFSYCGEVYETSLVGKYQIYNSITAISAAKILCDAGLAISKANIKNGLKAAKWPARFEILHRNPTVIADGSHNADGMNAFVETAKQIMNEKPVCVFGMLCDKDYDFCLEKLSEITDTVVVTEVDSPRKETVENLKKTAQKYIKTVYAHKDNRLAVEKALSFAGKNGTVIALGSLYMMKNIKDTIKKQDL